MEVKLGRKSPVDTSASDLKMENVMDSAGTCFPIEISTKVTIATDCVMVSEAISYGARYDGEWKQGMKHGSGKFLYPDGSWYDGSWKYNKKNGFGKYFYDNGDVYEGDWKDDLKHGVGHYKNRETGVFTRATWMNGELKGPIEIDYGNFLYHGHWNKLFPVGEGTFSFGMQHMLPGHVELIPSEIVEGKADEIEKKSSDVSKDSKESIQEASRVHCLPRFIAHSIEAYDYSKLPMKPIPLPTTDSTPSVCTPSSCSASEHEAHSLRTAPSIMRSTGNWESFNEEKSVGGLEGSNASIKSRSFTISDRD